jgi:hypothetical protein
MELGIAMAWRDFVCELCGREYSRMTGDLIVPSDTVCADCFEELGQPSDRELWDIISERRAAKDSESAQESG